MQTRNQNQMAYRESVVCLDIWDWKRTSDKKKRRSPGNKKLELCFLQLILSLSLGFWLVIMLMVISTNICNTKSLAKINGRTQLGNSDKIYRVPTCGKLKLYKTNEENLNMIENLKFGNSGRVGKIILVVIIIGLNHS